MTVRTYSPRQIALVYGGVLISGYAEDTFSVVEPSSDTFDKSVGASGEVSRVEKADRTGRMTLTLQQTSPSNEVLTGFHLADRQTLSGTLPFLLKDNNGNTLISAEHAWIMRLPDAGYNQEIGTREWIIDFDEMFALYGENNLS